MTNALLEGPVSTPASRLYQAARPLTKAGDGNSLLLAAQGRSNALACGVLADWLDERAGLEPLTAALRYCLFADKSPVFWPTNQPRTYWAWHWAKEGTTRPRGQRISTSAYGPAATLEKKLFRHWDVPLAGTIRSHDWLAAVCKLAVLLQREEAGVEPATKRSRR